MSQESIQPLVPEFRYRAVYRMRHAPADVRNKAIRVTPSSATQEAHDAAAVRQAHAVESYTPERELVQVTRLTGGPGGAAEVVLDLDEEMHAVRASMWTPHLAARPS